ncbi:hypothetical protein [Chryseobacterium elymi]|uniref:hypothetical protein n=1 Tax=Chryseobacterium elymi TaxID=395936 RepID=UPI001EE93060|nr:hypothetical protein [Chryseobacterium elymi]
MFIISLTYKSSIEDVEKLIPNILFSSTSIMNPGGLLPQEEKNPEQVESSLQKQHLKGD